MSTVDQWERFKLETGETPLQYVTRWANDERLSEANAILREMTLQSDYATVWCGFENAHDPHFWDGDGYAASTARCPGNPGGRP